MIFFLFQADVACRQLGFSESTFHANSTFYPVSNIKKVALKQIHCNGDENSLAECDHDIDDNCYDGLAGVR